MVGTVVTIAFLDSQPSSVSIEHHHAIVPHQVISVYRVSYLHPRHSNYAIVSGPNPRSSSPKVIHMSAIVCYRGSSHC